MTREQFYKNFNGVNCPSCRGAPYPAFDAASINEAEFADELRFKGFDTDFEEAKDGVDTVNVHWTSQEWNADGIDGVVKEVIRCFTHIGFAGNVILDIKSRDYGDDFPEEYAHREFTVG